MEVPTIAEPGLSGFEASIWFGLLAPAGSTRGAIVKVNGEGDRWLATPEAKEKLGSLRAIAASGSPEDFARHIATETAKWQQAVKASGAKAD